MRVSDYVIIKDSTSIIVESSGGVSSNRMIRSVVIRRRFCCSFRGDGHQDRPLFRSQAWYNPSRIAAHYTHYKPSHVSVPQGLLRLYHPPRIPHPNPPPHKLTIRALQIPNHKLRRVLERDVIPERIAQHADQGSQERNGMQERLLPHGRHVRGGDETGCARRGEELDVGLGRCHDAGAEQGPVKVIVRLALQAGECEAVF